MCNDDVPMRLCVCGIPLTLKERDGRQATERRTLGGTLLLARSLFSVVLASFETTSTPFLPYPPYTVHPSRVPSQRRQDDGAHHAFSEPLRRFIICVMESSSSSSLALGGLDCVWTYYICYPL